MRSSCVQIETHADRILQEIGMEIRGDDAALRLWKEAGADIEGASRVRVPIGLARQIVKRSAPAEFIQHARNAARSVTIGGSATVFAPAYGPPFVCDAERRPPLRHARGFQKFRQAGLYEPLAASFGRHHLRADGSSGQQAPFRHALRAHDPVGQAVHGIGHDGGPGGGLDRDVPAYFLVRTIVDSHCVILGNVNVNSPLVLDGEASRVIRTYAAANQAPVCVPFILGGAMGPVTTAGGLAQCFAEALFCVALAQLERPGSPVILGNFLSSMSLKSGAPTFGTPEPPLAYFAIGQLARRLGVPLRCGGNLCASKLPDAQAAYESASSLWPAFMAGANFVLHSAGWLEGGLVMSYEKFVMDAEQCGAFHVIGRGLIAR